MRRVTPAALRRLARAQALSGLVFAFFLTVHLATTTTAVLGPAGYDRMLARVRPFYRPLALVEAVLVVLPALVHVACALARIRLRRLAGPEPRPPLAARVHRWSGLFLLLALAGHVAATRVLVQADVSYLAFAVLRLPRFFVPYYLLLGTAGALHLSLGLGFALARLAPRADWAARHARVPAAAATILVIAGVLGIVAFSPAADRGRFPEFQRLWARFVPR